MAKRLKIMVDSREKTPWTFPADKVETVGGTLQTGDYTLSAIPDLAAIERKSLQDFVGCIGRGRERFKRELVRFRGYKCKAVIIEATVADVLNHSYRSEVNPRAVLGSAASWQTKYGVPFVWAGNRENAALICTMILGSFLRTCQDFAKSLSNC